jgi:hypothetical protein
MKNTHPARTSVVAPVLATATKALVTVLLTASALALLRTPGRAEEVFPTLVIKGQIYTNVSVVRTNPAEVVLRWEGAGGGTFKRQDLPPELAARYPYDPTAAEKWASEKALRDRRASEQDRESAKAAAVLAEQKRVQQRERTLQDLQRKESALKSQIPKTRKEVQDLQQVINTLNGKAKGTGKGSVPHEEANKARNQKLMLLHQIRQMEEQLSAVQEQISRSR